MPKNYRDFSAEVIGLLEENPAQTIKQMAEQLKVNRTFLAGYLKAMEAQGSVKSKDIGPARVYFVNSVRGESP